MGRSSAHEVIKYGPGQEGVQKRNPDTEGNSHTLVCGSRENSDRALNSEPHPPKLQGETNGEVTLMIRELLYNWNKISGKNK